MPLFSYIKSHHPHAFAALKTLRSFLYAIMEGSPAADVSSAPPFDPSNPAVPISYPLRTLEELESRAYFNSFHYPFNRAAVKLPGAELPNRPRILVCHDMAGGYTDDRVVQGGTNADAYAIWHWYLIDVFVYFSHNLVTLPPPCWVNTAHRHGVKVLGTFILEWDEGKKIADKLLSTKESAEMYADRLRELAVSLGFDGWLLNFEVKLDAGQIPNLKVFISHLSQIMHTSLLGSLVIWYDSVTVDGDLSWQDQLNDKNKPFFDLCDGIFTNYTWKEEYPEKSADAAGDRKFDVYMGIDVFGRNTYGGGQWTTNVALNVIKKNNVSAAIFAPGWVYETNQEPDFQTTQNRWWGLVEESWGTVQNYPKDLPFYSNFDQGRGYHKFQEGVQVSGTPWNNISSQSFQPFIRHPEDSATPPIKVSINFKDASYSGGVNVTFTGTLDDGTPFTARLFKPELLLGDSPVRFTFSVKSNDNSLLGLVLLLSSNKEEEKSILVAAPRNALLTTEQFSNHFTSVILPSQITSRGEGHGWVIQESIIHLPGRTLKEIRAICYRSIPSTSNEFYAALGDIKITSDGDDMKFPPANSWLINSRFISWTSGPQGSKLLSVKLIWKLNDVHTGDYPKFNVYVDKLVPATAAGSSMEYIGMAIGNIFYISDLAVDSGVSVLKFVIQPCGTDGDWQKLSESPFFSLPVQG